MGTESMENLVERLMVSWIRDTCLMSSTSEMIDHDDFRQLVGLGPSAIPFLNGGGSLREYLVSDAIMEREEEKEENV